MSAKLKCKEWDTYEDQEQIKTIPSFDDHVVVVYLAFIQINSPCACVGSQFLVDGILGVPFFEVKFAWNARSMQTLERTKVHTDPGLVVVDM